jgi:hypothetical protein
MTLLLIPILPTLQHPSSAKHTPEYKRKRKEKKLRKEN